MKMNVIKYSEFSLLTPEKTELDNSDTVENNKYCIFALFYSANVVGCPDNLSQRYFKECFVDIMKVPTKFEPHWLMDKNSDHFQITFFCVLLKFYKTTNIMSCPSFYSGRVVGCPGNRGSHVVCSESGGKHATLRKNTTFTFWNFQNNPYPLYRPLFLD